MYRCGPSKERVVALKMNIVGMVFFMEEVANSSFHGEDCDKAQQPWQHGSFASTVTKNK